MASPAAFQNLFGPVHPAAINRFLADNDTGIDGLYASFTKTEQQALKEGTGAFTHPRNRAFGYRTLIEHLVCGDADNRMPDGSIVPWDRYDFAVQKYNEAMAAGIWEPEEANLKDWEFCRAYANTAADILRQAKTNIDKDAERYFMSRYEAADGDDESQFFGVPKDPIERIAHDYMLKSDFAVVKA